MPSSASCMLAPANAQRPPPAHCDSRAALPCEHVFQLGQCPSSRPLDPLLTPPLRLRAHHPLQSWGGDPGCQTSDRRDQPCADFPPLCAVHPDLPLVWHRASRHLLPLGPCRLWLLFWAPSSFLEPASGHAASKMSSWTLSSALVKLWDVSV